MHLQFFFSFVWIKFALKLLTSVNTRFCYVSATPNYDQIIRFAGSAKDITTLSKVHNKLEAHVNKKLKARHILIRLERLGMSIRDLNRILVLSNRISVFRVYQNQSHSGYMKVRLGTGLDSIRSGSGSINLQRTGRTRCTFGFISQLVLRFKST